MLRVFFKTKLRKIHYPGFHFKVLTAVAAAQLAGLFMVSKHSAHHYLQPVLTLSGVTLFFIFLYFKELLGHYRLNPKILTAAAVIFFAILILVTTPVGKFGKTMTRLTHLKSKSMALHQIVEEKYKDYAKVFYYLSSSPVYALKFGNDLSRSYYSAPLEKLNKNVFFYDIWSKRFTGFDWHHTISFESIRQKYGDRIIFQGSRAVKFPGFQLKEESKRGFHEGILILE